MNNKTRQTLNRSKSQVRSGNYGGFRSNLQYVREVTEEEDDCSSLNNTGENQYHYYQDESMSIED